MMRLEFVPAKHYPWLPDYEEHDPNFDFSLFESNEPVEEDEGVWWLNRRIPGYSLRWCSLTHFQLMNLYFLHPNLFIFPWLPIARVDYWQ